MVDFGKIAQGATAPFVVVAVTDAGAFVPCPFPVTLTNDTDPSIGAASVNADGTNGVVAAGTTNGTGQFHVDGGGFTDAGTWTTVDAPVKIVGIAIQPIAGVAIKPA